MYDNISDGGWVLSFLTLVLVFFGTVMFDVIRDGIKRRKNEERHD